ncbi:hypothetical protein C9426_31800 [Serratia sp. S1B]|nr:hypothetical protein C9426_31800 [Serratia sp. S1B]
MMNEIVEETLPTPSGKVKQLLVYGAFALLVLAVATIGTKMACQSAEIARLQTALGQVPGQDVVQQELDRLGEQSNHNHQALLALSTALDKFKAAPAVDHLAFEQLVLQVRQLDSKVSQAVPSELQGLRSTLALLQGRIEVLEQPAASAGTVQPAVSITKPTAKKTAPQPVKVPAVVAPFQVTSIERRGGRGFVAIAPLQTFNLDDIRLMQTGDTYQGWTLLSAAGNQAQFSVAGRAQMLNVQ